MVRKNSIQFPSDGDADTCWFGSPCPRNPRKLTRFAENTPLPNCPEAILRRLMSRFLPAAVPSLDSFLDQITDQVADGLRFFPLTIGWHAALSAEILFLRKQLAC